VLQFLSKLVGLFLPAVAYQNCCRASRCVKVSRRWPPERRDCCMLASHLHVTHTHNPRSWQITKSPVQVPLPSFIVKGTGTATGSPRGGHGVGLPLPPGISIPVSCFHQISLCVVISCDTRGKSRSKAKTPLLLDKNAWTNGPAICF
jgi:hypothetical protein